MITEDGITKLLAKKHWNDIFIPQCKTGPTMYAGKGEGPMILDAWVMPRSWTKPIIGYEIKVTRQDFLRDHKWMGYTYYCNRFYFVVPNGLIAPGEICGTMAELAGLMYVTKNEAAVRIVKPAPFLRGIPSSEIFQYVLMWRMKEIP